MKLRHRRPSPALVVSTLALLVAMAGTGYAAFSLPKNSVGSKLDGTLDAPDSSGVTASSKENELPTNHSFHVSFNK